MNKNLFDESDDSDDSYDYNNDNNNNKEESQPQSDAVPEAANGNDSVENEEQKSSKSNPDASVSSPPKQGNEEKQQQHEEEKRQQDDDDEDDEEEDAELNDEDYDITGRKAPPVLNDSSSGVNARDFSSSAQSVSATGTATTKAVGGVNQMGGPRLVKVPDMPTAQFHKKGVTVHMAQLPKIVAIQPECYDEDNYNASIEEEEFQGRVHGMIRWRYKSDADGKMIRDKNGKLVKESNAKIIKWDDGSFGLCVGDEVFDLDEFSYQPSSSLQKNVAGRKGVNNSGGNKDYLFVTKEARVQVDNDNGDDENEDGETQPMGTVLECVVSLQSKFIPRPATLKSVAHKNFVLQERSRVIKRAQIQEYVTFVDPEKEKAERIRNKEDLMKQERRSGSRRSVGFDVGGAGGGVSSARKRHGMHRAYMEQDDDDEHYDSVNIRNLKRRNLDDEDMDYGDDADMSEEEDAWSKRKKKVFESGRKTGHLSKYEIGGDGVGRGDDEMNDDDEEQEFVVDDEDDDNDEFLSRKKHGSTAGQKRQAALFDDDDDDDDSD